MEFSFLYPAFLWGLPLVAGPVLIHWLTRPRPRPLAFSSLELLRQAAASRLSRSRLKNILLLLMRSCLLAALVLLFSRPRFHGAGAAAQTDGVTAVLLMDVSYSMEARHAGVSALDRAREQARLFLEGAGPRDRFGLVAFSNRVELSLPPTDDVQKVRQALEELSATARPTRVLPALDLASRLLAEDAENQKVVLVFSDLAENGWRFGKDGLAAWDAQAQLLLFEAGPAQPNAGVAWTRLKSPGLSDHLEGVFGVRAWGGGAGDRPWQVFLDGRPAAQGRVAVDAAESQAVFRSAGRGGGWGEIALEADALAVDDHFYFAAPRSRDFAVLAVNGAPSLTPVRDEAYYVSSVLDGLSRRGRRVRTVTAEDLAREDLSAWDVVLLMNAGKLPEEALSRLRAHLKKGGGLWVTAGDQVETSGPLAAFLPGRWTGPEARAASLRPAAGAREHLLGRALSEGEGFEWDKTRVQRVLGFEPAPGGRVLLETADTGRPVLAVGRALGGPVAVLATTLDSDWTNLPSKPAFPVLCREVLLFLAGQRDPSASQERRVDEPAEGALEDPRGELAVRRPDGTVDALAARDGRWLYEKTDRPGVYRVQTADGAPVAGFAVNLDVDAGEGDLARVSREEAESLVPARDVLWVSPSESVVEKFRERVRGKDVTPSLAAAALLLFSLESLLALFRASKKA